MFDQDAETHHEAGGLDLEVWRAELASDLEAFDLGLQADPFATPLRELSAVDGVPGRWDPVDVSDVELRAVALAAERTRRVLEAVSLAVLGELESRGVTDRSDGMRTGAWLARETGAPVGVTNRRVRLAERLRTDLPVVADALADGRLWPEHAQVLADAANPRILDEFPVAVPALIDLADRMPFAVWRREVAGVAELLDTDGGHRPDDPSANTASMRRGIANTWILHAELTDELGLPLHDALHAEANRLFHALHRDEDATVDLRVPAHGSILAMALAELAHVHQGATGGSAPRPDVSVIVNAADPDRVTDTDGVAIGDTHARTLLCDPIFRAVVTTVHGVVIALGRDQHLVNRAQRRALQHRDGGCVFPGCHHPAAWTDAHHVEHWQHGGPTDLANLALLCRYHHRVTHRDGWTMHTTHDQWFWWTTPGGDTFWSQRHQRPRAGPTPAAPIAA